MSEDLAFEGSGFGIRQSSHSQLLCFSVTTRQRMGSEEVELVYPDMPFIMVIA